MTTILVAADAEWVRKQVRTAFTATDTQVIEIDNARNVGGPVASINRRLIDAVAEHAPDLVILDMQIGNMGGVACAIELRLEAEAGRMPEQRIILLLDRDADRLLAKRAAADLELVKPVDAGVLRRAAKRLLSAAGADA